MKTFTLPFIQSKGKEEKSLLKNAIDEKFVIDIKSWCKYSSHKYFIVLTWLDKNFRFFIIYNTNYGVTFGDGLQQSWANFSSFAAKMSVVRESKI